MSFAERKRAELLAKLQSISDELARWSTESEPRAPLEKHYTQLRRLSSMLDTAISIVQRSLAESVDVSARWMVLEQQILGIHEVWDYFRSKFALRLVPWFHDYLAAADELAWACYEPARDAGVGDHNVVLADVQEPPLVFFNSVATLFAVARGSTLPTAQGGALSPQLFGGALRMLPISVIGIPWYQVHHLPDALVIGHEVGHTVETDFRLTTRLQELTNLALGGEAGSAERVDAWQAWLGEVFADVWGTLGCGPGFVSALFDFLAAPGSTADAPSASKAYPPSWLRARIVCDVLRVVGSSEADQLHTRWLSDVGDTPSAFKPWLGDAERVAHNLVESTYPQFGGRRLCEVLSFTALEESALGDAERLIGRMSLQASSARALMSAAALAFSQSPDAYVSQRLGVVVLARILKEQAIGTRGVRADSEWPRLDERDQAAGSELAMLLASEAVST